MADHNISTDNETWKPVAGFPHYEVSDRGRVRSLDRTRTVRHSTGVMAPRKFAGRVLTPVLVSGYHRVVLARDGKKHNWQVHHLVAEAFIGPAPGEIAKNLWQINHIDGCKTNNVPENLEWCTHAENHKHAGEKGLMPRGTAHHKSKLTPAEVRDIRRLGKAKNLTQYEIADMFGVSQTTVRRVIHRVIWAWLD